MVRFEISAAALLALATTRARFVARADGVAGSAASKHDPFDPFVPRNLLEQQEQQIHRYRTRLLEATRLDTSGVSSDYIDIDPLNTVEVADVGLLSSSSSSWNGCSGVERPVIGPDVHVSKLVYSCREDYGIGFSYDCNKLPCWNMSLVTNISYAFGAMKDFDEPLYWDTSRVEDMSAAFYGAKSFNQPLDHWDVSSVRDMSEMFYGTDEFNQPLDSWKTNSLETTSKMFYYAAEFNSPIESWNMGKVTDMSKMFSGAREFKQSLEEWDVSNVRDTSEMFYRAKDFNQPLNEWDVTSVTSMSAMFYYAEKFTQCLAKWPGKTVENVTVTNMFKQSKCRDTDDPDPNAWPWCKTNVLCTPWQPCGNNPDLFEKLASTGEMKNFTCTEIAEGNRRRNKVCDSETWRQNCPGLCEVHEECECSDFEHPFVPNRDSSTDSTDGDTEVDTDIEDEDEDEDTTTCKKIGKGRRSRRRCKKYDLKDVCRGSCKKGCQRKRKRGKG